MKKLGLSILFIFSLGLVIAQAPNLFKYQAVARNNAGDILANQSVAFEISILQNSTSGTSVYTETHAVTTNQHGLANLNIGGGAVVSGTFASIDWGAAIYFIQVKMDATGGTSYVLMGSSQLLSVPYALSARTVENIDWSEIDNIPTDLADGDDTGGAGTVDWSDLTGIPSDIADGDQSGGTATWGTLTGIPSDIADGDQVGTTETWGTLTGIPAGFSDNVDNDVLSGLTCATNQIALWNGTAWVCTTYYPTTGQFSASAYGTAQVVALVSSTTYALIPGLTQTIVVPANCRVIVSTTGGVQCAAAGVAFAAVDIGIHVDGVASTQAGQQQIIASNTDAVGNMLTYWNMTKTYNLAAGSHTIDVRFRDSGPGTADGNISGTNPLIQGVVTVTIINL